MPSPFPGMDPDLEQPAFWPDFHLTFISCWREIIVDCLPDSYDAMIGERVTPSQLDPETFKFVHPDLAIMHAAGPKRTLSPSGGVAVLEPEIIPQAVTEEIRESYIEILHRPDRSLVAVLELLSPSNKCGSGFFEYEHKRSNILRQKTHLLELDLLHVGQPPNLIRPLPPGDYRALLTRAECRELCHVFTWSMRQPLPTLPIPLRDPDPDIHVDLQAAFDLAYERGRYARSVRYDLPLAFTVPTEDRDWIEARRLAAAGSQRASS